MSNGKKLKIGLVFDDTLDSSDGVAQYVKTLGAWLAAQGHEVSYLVGETKLTEWSGGKVYSLAKNFKVRFNGNRLSIPGPARRWQIKQILASENFDVLHVQVPYSPLLAAQVINMAPAGTKVVGTFHIFPAGRLSRVGSRLLRLSLARSIRRFDEMLAVSLAAAEFAKQAYRLDTRVVPNAVDVARFSKPKKTAQKDIVFLGRLVERKGCFELLKAFNLLAQKMPEVNLKIAGVGAQEASFINYTRKNHLDKKVQFLGFVTEEEKARLLSSAAIACFPSLYGESFGIVLIEAMAAGAGVVLGGDNPGYRSVLGEQEKLLINPKDSKAFAARLEELLTDKKIVQSLHAWQLKAVRQYDVNVVGRQVLDAYLSVIDIKNKNEHNNR